MPVPMPTAALLVVAEAEGEAEGLTGGELADGNRGR
jgi:hypothetical protein